MNHSGRISRRLQHARSVSPSRPRALVWGLVAVFVGACHVVSAVAVHEAGHCALGAWPDGCLVYLAPLEGFAVVHGSETTQHAVIYALHAAFIIATVSPAAALAAMHTRRKVCAESS